MIANSTLHEISVYSVLSALLSYPDDVLREDLPILDEALSPAARVRLAPIFDFLEQPCDVIDLQEEYVATFDRRAAHSLHLFEHVHGESRDRGQAMVDLREEYIRLGLEPATTELPDYVPLFLEFLGQLPADAAEEMLGDAIHVLARLGGKLTQAGSPYACVLLELLTLTDVQPEELPEPPEGAMEEAMVTFGPEADGTEPLMSPPKRGFADGSQPITFHSPRPKE